MHAVEEHGAGLRHLRAGTDVMTWQASTFSPFAGVA
jgi:hypothetical protein